MRSIRILDCTLRDGGYCNQWAFGNDNIVKIVSNLVEAKIDIIECGFLSKKVEKDPNISKFKTIEDISVILPHSRGDSLFVAMMNYGEYRAVEIPDRQSDFIDGIRVAFHKKNMNDALNECHILKNKGYKVFVQAMVSMAYTDYEYLEMINKVNELDPYAFYIVDSFGMMKKKDMIRFFSLIENNLKSNISVGFHSHNNLQLAYSNALSLLDMRSGRDLIIDTSIYGMGRGAGNLNTELFIDHLNSEYDSGYDLKPLLSIMDQIINKFYQKNPWGYSLPNYLSATHNAHPNYAIYLADKNTLTIEMMDTIFACMSPDKKVEFDKKYAEQIYQKCMGVGEVRESNHNDFERKITGKTILLIGPAKSSGEEKDQIVQFAKEKNVVSVSVNFMYPHYNTDFIFISNMRRFREMPIADYSKFIITSNIQDADSYLQIDYKKLLNNKEVVKDNAGLMAIKLFMSYDINKIVLAGFDGYSYDALENFANSQHAFIGKKAIIDAINEGMAEVLNEYSNVIDIEFLTKPRHYRCNQRVLSFPKSDNWVR